MDCNGSMFGHSQCPSFNFRSHKIEIVIKIIMHIDFNYIYCFKYLHIKKIYLDANNISNTVSVSLIGGGLL